RAVVGCFPCASQGDSWEARKLKNPRRYWVFWGLTDLHSGPAGQILHVLPGNAARPRAARGGPFQRLTADRVGSCRNLEILHIGRNHSQELILTAAVKAKPETETIRQ